MSLATTGISETVSVTLLLISMVNLSRFSRSFLRQFKERQLESAVAATRRVLLWFLKGREAFIRVDRFGVQILVAIAVLLFYESAAVELHEPSGVFS